MQFSRKQSILDDISKKNMAVQGMLTVKATKIKAGKNLVDDKKPMKDYLFQFSRFKMSS